MDMKINEYMNFYRNKENYVSYSLDNISFMSALKLLFLSFFHYVFSKSISATHIHNDWKRILESLHVAFVPQEQWNRIIKNALFIVQNSCFTYPCKSWIYPDNFFSGSPTYIVFLFFNARNCVSMIVNLYGIFHHFHNFVNYNHKLTHHYLIFSIFIVWVIVRVMMVVELGNDI